MVPWSNGILELQPRFVKMGAMKRGMVRWRRRWCRLHAVLPLRGSKDAAAVDLQLALCCTVSASNSITLCFTSILPVDNPTLLAAAHAAPQNVVKCGHTQQRGTRQALVEFELVEPFIETGVQGPAHIRNVPVRHVVACDM